MEACCTLGMLTDDQARRLKDAGLDAYNHNLDTSRRHYHDRSSRPGPTTTGWRRSAHVAAAGISVCCGGILGMGETEDDRISCCTTLANLTAAGERADQLPRAVEAARRWQGRPRSPSSIWSG